MTSRLGIEIRGDRIEWAVLHRVLRGPMQLTTGSLPAAVGVDDRGRLVPSPADGQPGVRDRIDRLAARLGDATPLIVDGVPYGAERLLATVIAAAVAAGTRAAHDIALHTVLVHPDGLDVHLVDLLRETARYAGIAATSSVADGREAADALVRVPIGGAGHGAAVAAAQLAWERRPDDDHTGAALGTAGGSAVIGAAAVLGVDRSAASAPSPSAGPTGTPLVAPVAGPVGAPIAAPVAGPTGARIASPVAGPRGAPLTAPEITAAEHDQPRRKRTPRTRHRIVVAATTVVVIGTGVGIIAATGDDATTTQVVTTDTISGTTADTPVIVTSAATLPAEVTAAPTESGVTTVTSAEPSATEVAAPAAPTAPSSPVTVVAAPGAPAATSGWMISESLTIGSFERHFEALSCASELGPWHIVETIGVDGLLSADASFDVTLGPDFTGTSAGSERSSWFGGMEVTATRTGTANLASQSTGGYLLFIDYDEDVQIVDPVDGDETQHHHRTLELHVLPAAAGLCP